MTVHAPLWLQPAGADPDITYTGQELRQMIRASAALGSPLDVQGVVSAGAYAVTQRAAGANFSVDVAAGHAYVVGDDVSGQGTYLAWNDGTVNVATPTAPASGTRVHRLVLQIQDKLSNGTWIGYTAALTLLQDTGGGTPAEPNSALTLALISITAGQASVLNANITDQRPPAGNVFARKAADQSVTSSTTLVNDSALTVPLAANAIYEMVMCMLYTASPSGDLAVQLTGPTGAAVVVGISCIDSAGTAGTDAALTSRNGALPQPVTVGGVTGQTVPVLFIGTLTTSGATGPLQVQFAQGTSNATATVVKAGSYLRCNRIG